MTLTWADDEEPSGWDSCRSGGADQGEMARAEDDPDGAARAVLNDQDDRVLEE